MFDPNTRKQDYNALVDVLEAHGAKFLHNGRDFKCPFHDDHTASGQVKCSPSGYWRFACYRCEIGGTVWDAESEATGISVSRLMSEERAGTRPARPTCIKKRVVPEQRKEKLAFDTSDALEQHYGRNATMKHRYFDADGTTLRLLVMRIPKDGGGKMFWQASKREDGKWTLENHMEPNILYNLKGISESQAVIVVEGEKAADALISIGICATTSPMGKGNADETDWSPLAGKKVFIWRDFDDDGLIYQDDVSKLLEQLTPQPNVRCVYVDGLGLDKKGDAYDFIARIEGDDDTKKKAVREALMVTKPTGLLAEFDEMIEEAEKGLLSPVSWPWRQFNEMVQFSMPGTVSLLVGQAGSTKSFMLMEAANHWYDNKIPFAIYELEDKRRYHAMRALAQRVAIPQMLNMDWFKQNAELMRELRNEYADFLTHLGNCIDGESPESVTHEQLTTWVKKKAESGAKVIVIDPITAAAKNLKPWVDDGKMIQQMKVVAMDHNINIVFVSHPRKGANGMISMDEIAGGADYARLFQSIIWLERHAEPKQSYIHGSMMYGNQWHNRTIHHLKGRMSQGQGNRIAMDFTKNMTFTEKGIITSEKQVRASQKYNQPAPHTEHTYGEEEDWGSDR